MLLLPSGIKCVNICVVENMYQREIESDFVTFSYPSSTGRVTMFRLLLLYVIHTAFISSITRVWNVILKLVNYLGLIQNSDIFCTVNYTTDRTLWTLYRSYFEGIRSNIKLKVYSVTCSWRTVLIQWIFIDANIFCSLYLVWPTTRILLKNVIC
jgi:hypothetical protein